MSSTAPSAPVSTATAHVWDASDTLTAAATRSSNRRAGWGAIVFVAVVIAQNVVRGALAPQNNATIADVLTYYQQNRGVELLLATTFVVSGTGLVVFLGGAMRRLANSRERAWAYTGFAGALGIMALFSIVLGTESALVAVAGRATPNPAAMDALWSLHNGVFAILSASIAFALFGFSRAGVSEGITPRFFSWLAPVGAVLLGIGAATAPLTADGSAMVFTGISGLGFLAWLLFLATTGARLIRQP